ncbi:MAG: DUF4332 domain-containing protein [Mastigocoleus sp. MO_167.B18]|nr:DUF4332 domain-containing protein [Mastigocoleus sp. MO_167.B18]
MSSPHKSRTSNMKFCNWSIEKLPGLSEQERSQLQSCGIANTLTLVQQGKTPQDRLMLAHKLHIHLQHVNKWVALADLARIPSVGLQYCGLLLHAGVISAAHLATIPPYRLHKQILRLQVATMQRRDLCPAVEEVQQWIQQAKTFMDKVR